MKKLHGLPSDISKDAVASRQRHDAGRPKPSTPLRYDAAITAGLRPGDAVIWKNADGTKELKAEFIKEEPPGSLIVRIFEQPTHSVIPKSAVMLVIQGRFLNPAHRTVGLDQP